QKSTTTRHKATPKTTSTTATAKATTPKPAPSAAVAPKPAYSATASQARKARLARARAAARTRETERLRVVQEPMTPRYKTDAHGHVAPGIRAAAAIILDPATGQVLWQENAQDKRSIASITKVMTTVVFLEDNPDLSREITVERGDVFAASTTHLRANDRLSLGDGLHLVLIAADNAGARILARSSPGGTPATAHLPHGRPG